MNYCNCPNCQTANCPAAIDEAESGASVRSSELVRRVRELESAIAKIKIVMAGPASNRRFMQIAGPARHCLNIIKAVEAPNAAISHTADSNGGKEKQ